MKENAKKYSSELMKALDMYWEEFLFAVPRIAIAIVILIIFLLLASYISKVTLRRLSGKAHDPLFATFVGKSIKLVVIVVGALMFLQIVGLRGIASGLLAGAGISALVFGFAFKDIAENFLAGIILAFNRPFSLDDTIRIRDYTGHIKALNFRTTHIKTFDEKDVFIPNAIVMKETLINLTRDGMLRIDFAVGIAYEDGISAAVETILKAVNKVEGLLSGKAPFVVVEELDVSTVNLRVFFWTDTDDYKKGVLITKSNVILSVKEALLAKGFTLPANIQELKLYDKRDSLPLTVISEKDTAERRSLQ